MLTHRIQYAIPLNEKTWVNTMEIACVVLEGLFPQYKLMTAQAEKDYANDKPISNRIRFLQSRLKRSGWEFDLHNGKANYLRPDGKGGFLENGHLGIAGRFYERKNGVYLLDVDFQTSMWDECIKCLISLGDAINAYAAQILPFSTIQKLTCYERFLSGNLTQILGLHRSLNWDIQYFENEIEEALKLKTMLINTGRTLPIANQYGIRHHPAQPIALGWLNYWSAETCSYLGFPDPMRDRDLLAHSYPTPGGAWLVKLSAEPLDFDRPEHLEIFADVYARFPKLGLRVVKKADEPPSFTYPEHTTYIQDGKLLHVFENIVSFFRSHGYQILDRLPKKASADNIVTIGLISGETDWTVLKTLPSDFLANPIPGKEEPMLFELCRKTQCAGFLLNIHSECEALLLEAAADGRTCQSGIQDFEGLPDDVDFEAMGESGNPPVVEFRLLPIGIDTDIGNIDDYGQIAEQLHGLLIGKNADLCGDKSFVETVTSNVWQNRQGVRLFLIPAQPRVEHNSR